MTKREFMIDNMMKDNEAIRDEKFVKLARMISKVIC